METIEFDKNHPEKKQPQYYLEVEGKKTESLNTIGIKGCMGYRQIWIKK